MAISDENNVTFRENCQNLNRLFVLKKMISFLLKMLLNYQRNEIKMPEIPQRIIVNSLTKGISSRRNFTKEEDERLLFLVQNYGVKNWEFISKMMPFRTVRQCKDRYKNYLAPEINLKPWTNEEDLLLIKLFNELGQKWVQISRFFKGRSDNSIKNRWYNHLKQINEPTTQPKNNVKEEIKLYNEGDQSILNDMFDFDDMIFDNPLEL